MPSQSTYYFAWTDPSDSSFNSSHWREDELIFSFELTHAEGQFAELVLEIANPYVGLLNPNRATWAWFSWNDGVNVHPLFRGRLVAVPDNLFGEVLKIKLVAKPSDYVAQQTAVAESMKQLPYFDPIFVDVTKLDDPDTILEGYSKLWHVDRLTLQVTASDIITGEDGTTDFPASSVFYDAVEMKLAGAPLLLCEINAEVSWTQCDHTGVFEMQTVPDLVGNTNVADGINITSGVSSGSGGGGSSKKDEQETTQTTYSWDYKNVSPGPHNDGDLMESSGSISVPFYGGELTQDSESSTNADPETGQGEEYSHKQSFKMVDDDGPHSTVPLYQTPIKLGTSSTSTDALGANSTTAQVAVEVQQDRKEQMYVALQADVQPVLASLTEDDNNLIETLSMNARDLVDAGVATASDGVYFSTPRGHQSIHYLLMVARAHLLAGSRVVEIDWECPFSTVIGLSCRMNARIEDPRLPGANAVGKIVEYVMSGDGDSGDFHGKVTTNSAVGNYTLGKANARAADPGVPVYVEEGYVDPGYQFYEGQRIISDTADFDFETVPFEAVGLQLPITEEQILVRHEYNDMGAAAYNSVQSLLQSGAAQLRAFQFDPITKPSGGPPAQLLAYSQMEIALNNALAQARDDNPSWVEMEFKPVKGISTQLNHQISAGPLSVPQQIDLTAS